MVFPRIVFEESWRVGVDRTTYKESPGLKESNVLNLERSMSQCSLLVLAMFMSLVIHLRQINIL